MLVRSATTCRFVLDGIVAGVTCTASSVLLAASSAFGFALPNPEGWLASPPQLFAGDALLRGIGPAMMKSARLLFVSTQPFTLRIAAVVLARTAVGFPSKQLALPYPTRSTMLLPAGQTLPFSGAVSATRATLPLLAPRAIPGAGGLVPLRVVSITSAAGKGVVPPLPWDS